MESTFRSTSLRAFVSLFLAYAVVISFSTPLLTRYVIASFCGGPWRRQGAFDTFADAIRSAKLRTARWRVAYSLSFRGSAAK